MKLFGFDLEFQSLAFLDRVGVCLWFVFLRMVCSYGKKHENIVDKFFCIDDFRWLKGKCFKWPNMKWKNCDNTAIWWWSMSPYKLLHVTFSKLNSYMLGYLQSISKVTSVVSFQNWKICFIFKLSQICFLWIHQATISKWIQWWFFFIFKLYLLSKKWKSQNFHSTFQIWGDNLY